MGRKILGVVAGYLTMVAFIFITFTLTYLVLGTEGSFRTGSYDVSALWIIASIILGFAGAILGGLVCYAISRSPGASMTLAGIVLVLGIAMAVPSLSADLDRPVTRSGEVGAMEAMQDAHQPTWLAFLNPVIGAVGVTIGSRLKRK